MRSWPPATEAGWIRGKKDGTFEKLRALEAGVGPSTIATGDLDGDGRPDLVTADEHTVTVLLNRP